MTSPLHAAAIATRQEQMLLARNMDYSTMSEVPDKLAAIAAATAAFSEAGVSYALIGGLAVAVRSGVPRSTLDVDFAIPTGADVDRLVLGLASRGFELVGRFAHSINFKHPSVENLELRCTSHNILAAEQDFGREHMDWARGLSDSLSTSGP